MRILLNHGVRFHQIAGNEMIALSAVFPAASIAAPQNVQVLLKQPVLGGGGKMRFVFLAKVNQLHEVVPSLERGGVTLEHLYDY